MFFPENQFKLILNEFLKGRKVNQNLNKMMFRKMKKVLAPKKNANQNYREQTLHLKRMD